MNRHLMIFIAATLQAAGAFAADSNLFSQLDRLNKLFDSSKRAPAPVIRPQFITPPGSSGDFKWSPAPSRSFDFPAPFGGGFLDTDIPEIKKAGPVSQAARKLSAAPRPALVSSLQYIVDYCGVKPGAPIRNSSDFLRIYGRCLIQAKGLRLTDVRPDLTDPAAVLVYAKDRKDILSRMNGTITVATPQGPFRIRVYAARESHAN